MPDLFLSAPHKCNLTFIGQPHNLGVFYLLWYLKCLASHTDSHGCTCSPYSHNISPSHRHCILLHLGASDSECVLTWTVSTLWSWASWHIKLKRLRSSSIEEYVFCWWTINSLCYGHSGLRGSNDATAIMKYRTMNIRDEWVKVYMQLYI